MSSRSWPSGWFDPRAAEAVSQLPLSPPESYWQGVWRRFRANPRALGAGIFLLVLCTVVLLAPAVWPIDAVHQNPFAASRGPMPARALPVVPMTPWTAPTAVPTTAVSVDPLPADQLPAAAGFQAVLAHTEAVRLVWQPVPGARSYRLYRREANQPEPGMPLAFLPGTQTGYEDRLNLQAQEYHYSLLAGDGLNDADTVARLTVLPQAVIGLLDAQLQGLLPEDAVLPEDGNISVNLPAHPLGTDYLGRDLLSRLVEGARTSLFVGIVAPLIFILIGVFYGAFSGYAGGRVDEWMMRFADFVIALPFLLFMILLRIALGVGPGESGIGTLILAMALMGWPMAARLVRGQVLQLREQAFVQAARLMGASAPYLIVRHMIPHVTGVIIVSLTFAVPGAIFTEAFLSFIGMGVAPPTPSWGSLCNDGLRSMLSHPYELIFPALCISLTVLAFNLLGDGLRDALDINLESAR